MSFGEGNLHEKCEMYRRQLGGVNAASNRKSGEIRRLRAENDELRDEVARLRREASDLKDMVGELSAAAGSLSADPLGLGA